MDGDLQHPPEVVPRLLEEARRSGADAVVASRYAGHGTVGEFGRVRRLLSRGSAMLARLLFFRRLRRVSDPMSGFFLVRREAIDPCVLRPRGFKILLEILVRSRLGTIREVPFAFGLRHAGASKASLREAARYVGQLLRLRAGERALRFARFAIVGATGIVVNTVVLFTLIELTHLYYLVSAFLATQVSITSNYLLSERWVFSGSGAERSVRWRLATFFLMSNAALGLGGPTLFVLVSVLGVRYLLANLVTIAIVAGVRFAAADAWIWRAAAHRAPAHAAEPAPAVRLGPEAEPAATIAA
jgi:dolichol-phosphate mannosyltransferase